MKKAVDPRQLLFPLEYSKKNTDSREESFAVEQRDVKKAVVISFNSFMRCVEHERQLQEKNVLLSAAQKLKW